MKEFIYLIKLFEKNYPFVVGFDVLSQDKMACFINVFISVEKFEEFDPRFVISSEIKKLLLKNIQPRFKLLRFALLDQDNHSLNEDVDSISNIIEYRIANFHSSNILPNTVKIKSKLLLVENFVFVK